MANGHVSTMLNLVYIYTGLSLFGVSGNIGINLNLMHALTFSSLIAAVDPVAVSRPFISNNQPICHMLSLICILGRF